VSASALIAVAFESRGIAVIISSLAHSFAASAAK
jgi:hypothetical protein